MTGSALTRWEFHWRYLNLLRKGRESRGRGGCRVDLDSEAGGFPKWVSLALFLRFFSSFF